MRRGVGFIKDHLFSMKTSLLSSFGKDCHLLIDCIWDVFYNNLLWRSIIKSDTNMACCVRIRKGKAKLLLAISKYCKIIC